MKKLLKNCAFVLALSLTYTSVYADDNYCMENDGYIYPIFESKVCDTSDDIILNQKEFSYLFDFEKNKRLAQLTEYRKNPEKFETRKESDLIKKLPKVKNQKNLTDEEKEKIKLEQKRLAKISKEEKIKLKKQENEERKKQRLAEQEKKKRKRLAEIAKREELKKIKKRKQEEKLAKKSIESEVIEIESVLDGVPRAMPALERSRKIQKRAANVGFDWQEISPVVSKLKEEIEELEEAIGKGNSAAVEAELGDVLFSAVNIARHTDVDPESALRKANSRFENRFKWIEQKLQSDGKSVTEMNLQQLDQLWEESKFNGL